MKAIILAAGHGTRLKPLTDTTPKCLLPVCGVPMLGIWLNLCRLYGIGEVLINSHSHRESIRKFVRENSDGLTVRITEEKDLLGSAGTLLENRAWIGQDSEFWILYGDVLTNANLARMLRFHRRHKQAATIGVYEVANPSQCGIVTVDDRGVVCDFVEKPENPSSNLAFAGLMVATPSVFEEIPSTTPVDIGFHLLPRIVGRMAAYPISDYLLDIGTSEKYDHAQRTWPGLKSGVSSVTPGC